MTTYPDMDALYVKGTGTPNQLRKTGNFWSYPGCTLDGVNLQVPRENVPDNRVQAALADGSWLPFEVDAGGAPVAVIPATSEWVGRPVITPAEVGTARVHPPVQFRFRVFRAGAELPIGIVTGQWLAAWKLGLVAEPNGGNLSAGVLIFRTMAASAWTPAAGDVVRIHGTNYSVTSAAALDGGLFDVVLKRPNLGGVN